MTEKQQSKPKKQDTSKDKKPKARKRRNPFVPKFFEKMVSK